MKKTKQIIIGFIGDHNSGKATAANLLKKKGFYKISINKKVEEFANHLFQKSELDNNRFQILNNVRKRGVMVNKEYWLNLALISVPDDKNLIVFDDLSLDEASNKKIKVYQIYRPNVSTVKLEQVETIINDGSLNDFTDKIEALYKSLLKNNPN